MNKHALIPMMIAFASLTGCSAAQVQEEAPLSGARMGGAFTLTNQDGKTVSDKDFAGQYRLIYFGYSFCPDVCPVDVQQLMQGYRLLEKADAKKAAKLQPIFITVDPQRDTVPVIKQFVTAFHPKLIGLTGSEAQIADVAKRYAAVYQKAEGGTKDAYLMDHSRTAVLYAPDGSPVALIPQDGSPQEIAGELTRWVR
ncbi:MAG: SCO family protein [Rhodospirillales bacterium]|nr:SCO family protein [Rhodospirillales bacterium]